MATPPIAPAVAEDPRALADKLRAKTESYRKLNVYLDERWQTATHRRSFREATWFRNLEYIRGRQWIYVTPRKTVESRPLPFPDFPRAVTNRIGQIVGDLENFIVQSQLPLLNQPGTDNPDDIATAEACDRFDDVIYEEVNMRNVQRVAAAWLIATGNVFIIPYYDYSPEWGVKDVDFLQCQVCGFEAPDGDESVATATATIAQAAPSVEAAPMCPQCLEQSLISPLSPLTKQLPIGKLINDVCSPFEILFDSAVPYGQKRDWFFRKRRYPVEKVKELWPEFKDKVREGMAEPKSHSSIDFLEALSFADTTLSAGGAENPKKMVTVVEYRELPCAKYPDGLYVVRIGADIIAEEGPLPNEFKVGQRKGQKWLPLRQIVDIIDAGSAWGRSRVNDLIAPQTRRNIVESLMQLTFQRTGGPKLLVPTGAGITNVSGAAGQQLGYRPIPVGSGSAFAKPEYLEGALANLQPILAWMALIDDQMEGMAGTKWITGGDVPSGVTAASGLALLDERAVRALRKLKEQWVEGFRDVKMLDIEILREHMTDERLMVTLGRNRQWQAEQFKMADLQGSVNVVVNYEAMFPKSEATKRATMNELVQIGVLNPQNPETQYGIAQEFGATHLLGGVNEATQMALREFDRFLKDETYQPLRVPGLLGVPEMVARLIQCRKDAMSQEFEQLLIANPQRAQVWHQHVIALQTEIFVAGSALGGPMGAAGGAPSDQQGSSVASMSASEEEPAAVRKGRAVAESNDQRPPEEAVPAESGMAP